MADRRTFVLIDDVEKEIRFEDLKVGNVFRLEEPDGARCEPGWLVCTEAPTFDGVTWGVVAEPRSSEANTDAQP